MVGNIEAIAIIFNIGTISNVTFYVLEISYLQNKTKNVDIVKLPFVG